MSHALVQRVLVPAGFILLWSSAYIVVRMGLPDMSPIASLALRFVIAATTLFVLAQWMGQPLSALGRRWPHFAVSGALMNGIYLTTAYVALQYLTAGTMGLLAALNPMLTALLGLILLGERMRLAQWLGLGLGVGGVVLVVGLAPVPGRSVTAALLAVGGIIAFAVGTIYFRRYCGPSALLAGNAVQMGSAAVFCALLAAAFEPLHVAWTWRLIGCTVYLALAVSVGAMGLFGYMLRSRTAGVVSSNFYVIPGLTAVLAWLVLGETLTPTAMAGFCISSIGVWLAQREAPSS
ncbi:MAG TPA: DMT family transporter [Terriglobales bacterium]|nr:DMT family transporter [Terriglobales bacterium]